jgi:nucleoside 2-deoxyribosyltransferase
MKVYLTYKFKEKDPVSLRKQLEEFSKLIEDATGWNTYVHFRDSQNWVKTTKSVKEVFEDALKNLKRCDAILAEASVKSRGVYLEVGYAKALGKKIIIVHQKGTEANLLEAMADMKIEYDTFEDLKKKLKEKKW